MTTAVPAARLPRSGAPLGPASTLVRRARDFAGERVATVRDARTVAVAVLLATAGLGVQVLGYVAGWSGEATVATVAYYIGQTLLVGPFVVVLLAPGLSGTARRWAALAYGVLLYLSWWLTSPIVATRFDETLHVATLAGLASGQGFFHPNPMLPVSPHYPGLELAAYAVWWLTGLPPAACQAAITLLCRVVLVAAFFALAQRIAGSSRVGAVAVLLYSASPQFYFFNAQFAYQTLALPLLIGALVLLLEAGRTTSARARRVRVGTALACLVALAVTHHVTSWLTAAVLLVLLPFLARGRSTHTRRVALAAAVAVVAVLAWTAVVGPMLGDYIGPVLQATGDQMGRLLALDGAQRQVGADGGGVPTPPWEFAIMAVSILLWLGLLAAAGVALLRGRVVGLARMPVRWPVLAAAAGYPALLSARFAPKAAEMADRLSTFVLLAVALLGACWLGPRLTRWRGGRRVAGAVAGLVLVSGGIMLGAGPDWQRQPGPYLAGAEQRSVDATTIAAARWAGRYLPAGSRIAGDLTLDRVLPDFAPVQPVTSAAGDLDPTPLFLAPTVTADDLALIRADHIDFVVVDTRIAGQMARSGNLFNAGSDFGPALVRPSLAQLVKFTAVPGARVVLDGPIRIYDLRAFLGEPTTLTRSSDPVLPGQWRPLNLAFAAGLAVVLLAVAATATRGAGRSWITGGAPTALVAVLPLLVAAGALAVPFAGRPWTGAVAAAVLAVGAVLVSAPARREAALAAAGAPAGARPPVGVLVATGALLSVIVGVAILASWRGLMTAPEPPPPPASAVAGTAGGHDAPPPSTTRATRPSTHPSTHRATRPSTHRATRPTTARGAAR